MHIKLKYKPLFSFEYIKYWIFNRIKWEERPRNLIQGKVGEKIKELNKVEANLEIIQDNIFPYYTFHYILLRDYYQKKGKTNYKQGLKVEEKGKGKVSIKRDNAILNRRPQIISFSVNLHLLCLSDTLWKYNKITNFSSSTVTHSRTSEIISNAHVYDLVRVEIPGPCVKYRESLENFGS